MKTDITKIHDGAFAVILAMLFDESQNGLPAIFGKNCEGKQDNKLIEFQNPAGRDIARLFQVVRQRPMPGYHLSILVSETRDRGLTWINTDCRPSALVLGRLRGSSDAHFGFDDPDGEYRFISGASPSSDI